MYIIHTYIYKHIYTYLNPKYIHRYIFTHTYLYISINKHFIHSNARIRYTYMHRVRATAG